MLPDNIISKILLYNSHPICDQLKQYCKYYETYYEWCNYQFPNDDPEPFYKALHTMIKIDNKYNKDYIKYCKWYETNSIDNKPDNYFVFFVKSIKLVSTYKDFNFCQSSTKKLLH
jgi:hypothetical protein